MKELNTKEAPKEDKSQNENKGANQEGNQSETPEVNLGENLQENTPMVEVKEDEPGNNNESEKMREPEKNMESQKGQKMQKEQESQKEQEPEKSISSKEIQSNKDKASEKEKIPPVKMTPIRPDFRKSVEVKFSPYPSGKPIQQGVKTKATQIVQIKSGKNQVFVVPPGAQVIPFSPRSSTSSTSPSVMPFSIVNPSPPTIRVPLITQVTSLQKGPPVTKFIPVTTVGAKPRIPHPINNVIPVTKVLSGSQVSVVGKVPLVTRVNPGNSAAKMTPVSGVAKMTTIPGVCKGNLKSVFGKVPPISEASKVSPISAPTVTSPSLPQVPEKYDRHQLLCDLQRNPLPTGWAYKLLSEDKILFMQYCIHRKFPIFLRLNNDLTGMVRFLRSFVFNNFAYFYLNSIFLNRQFI